MFSWRGKEEFVENTQKKCVTIHANGDFEHGKVIYIEPDWTYLDLLGAASQRLDLVPTAKRVFNANGVEIDDCMMIEDDDILFLSNGDDYIAPTMGLGSTEKSGSGERDKIPNIIGGYKIGKFLGRGGFGEVRVGEHQLTGEKVALKFLRKSDIASIGAAERTITEIQCLTTLKHQNIIRLQQHMESNLHVVLVFELMEGGDLFHYLSQRGTTAQECALSEDEARHVFHQVLGGVSFAHNQHICHRDLKLENILLKGHTLALVKIADFGLSDFYRPGATMKSSCGTLSFLAPEVFRGTSNAGPPLDVWSLGVILFALLCGRLPFEGPDLAGTKRPRDAIIRARITKCQYKMDEHLGPEAKDLVRRMLKLDPAERASLPEVFNHCWLRSLSNAHHIELLMPPPSLVASPAGGSGSRLVRGGSGKGRLIGATGPNPVVPTTRPSSEGGLRPDDSDMVGALGSESGPGSGSMAKLQPLVIDGLDGDRDDAPLVGTPGNPRNSLSRRRSKDLDVEDLRTIGSVTESIEGLSGGSFASPVKGHSSRLVPGMKLTSQCSENDLAALLEMDSRLRDEAGPTVARGTLGWVDSGVIAPAHGGLGLGGLGLAGPTPSASSPVAPRSSLQSLSSPVLSSLVSSSTFKLVPLRRVSAQEETDDWSVSASTHSSTGLSISGGGGGGGGGATAGTGGAGAGAGTGVRQSLPTYYGGTDGSNSGANGSGSLQRPKTVHSSIDGSGDGSGAGGRRRGRRGDDQKDQGVIDRLSGSANGTTSGVQGGSSRPRDSAALYSTRESRDKDRERGRDAADKQLDKRSGVGSAAAGGRQQGAGNGGNGTVAATAMGGMAIGSAPAKGLVIRR